ncbi:unnamed protein product [Strongylus vulgaris]|uniref:Uncharacterized protein n=1 Tax=Strongylus vulgaris TaxID=40348 RepID=A0A3P7LMU7_STRVU|nr:unnamed protein product [Strongylus vulgaris]
MDKLLEDLATEIIKYPSSKGNPFTWPAPAGMQGDCMAFRARITYDFWRFFMQEGRKLLDEYNKQNGTEIKARITYDFWKFFMQEERKLLDEYNKQNGTEIKVNREKILTSKDQDRLGLYIRKMIKEEYKKNNMKGVDITLRKSLLKIGENEPMKPAVVAILLDMDLSNWNGLPLDQLLTDKEKDSTHEASGGGYSVGYGPK